MRKNNLSYPLLLIVFFFIFSCSSEEQNYPSHNPTGEVLNGIHPDFKYFVDSFKEEALKRNLVLDYSGLSVQYAANDREDAVGWCAGFNSIYIEKPYWETIDSCIKERIIFHELGHCVLSRGHSNKVLNNYWVSIMRGKGDGWPNGDAQHSDFIGLSREYYINELFDPETPLPLWLQENQNFDQIVESKSLIKSWDQITNESLIEINLDKSNYMIEINLDEKLEHPPITVTGGGLVVIESIRLESQNKNISIDLALDQLKDDEGNCTDGITGIKKDATSISLVNLDDQLYFFTDDQLDHFSFPLVGSLQISNILLSGIKDIKYYQL